MRLLVVTNLYPPQELGGYGRCIADFVWGLQRLGHSLHVVSADAPYLSPVTSFHGPSGESVQRDLILKGSYEFGISFIDDESRCIAIDKHNNHTLSLILDKGWDAILLGNIDLIGPEIFSTLLNYSIPVLHHIGFISAPYSLEHYPFSSNYCILPASNAVRQALVSQGFPVSNSPVVYPGARTELFRPAVAFSSPALDYSLFKLNLGDALGTPLNPLKIGFAGLLMGSKGLHTVVHALILLHNKGVSFQAMFAGADFQLGYRNQLESVLNLHNLRDFVIFVGQLNRPQLSRFWSLQHIGIFPSIHPEAFGIVGAEILSSGVCLITSGVGGSSELIQDGVSGMLFEPDNPSSLANSILSLISNPSLLYSLSIKGCKHVHSSFSVETSALLIQRLIGSASTL